MIPARAHFIWYGSRLPLVYQLAFKAARDWGQLAEVQLHHDQDFEPACLDPALARDVVLRPISRESHFAALGARGSALFELHERLRAPAARANIVRMCILGAEGGVYLDTDAVCVAPMGELLGAGAFCGEEHILFPGGHFRRLQPVAWSKSLSLAAARLALRELPRGYRYFKHLAPYFPRKVNNAVVGAQAGHPFILGMLDAMLTMPRRAQERRFALGTHLLQAQVQRYVGPGLVVHPPEVFYPLPPEISQHWFRHQSPPLDQVLDAKTRVVHWYASVRLRGETDRLDRAYVREHRDSQLFSKLVYPLLASD